MSSFNRKNQKIYAEERRKQNRLNQEKLIQTDVEDELYRYFAEQNFEALGDLEPFYPAVYEFIKRKAPSLNWKKYAHEFFRAYIKQKNLNRNEPLALPSLTFDMKRDQPIVTMQWIVNGHYIDEVIDRLWDYWILAKDSTVFSDDEIIGNIILSAMLYSGLNQKTSLNALLEHLKDPAKIRCIDDINIIFLEPFSPSYGDLFIDEKTIRKSRNFIPDQMTRLWLIHFNTRQIRNVYKTIEYYLEIVFHKIKLPFNKNNFKRLRDYSNFNWIQLSDVDIDPALSQCLIENIETCGLSENEFERFFQPKFKYHQDSQNGINIQKTSSNTIDQFCPDDSEQVLNNTLKIHKDFLKIIRTTHTEKNIDLLMIEYCAANISLFNEFTKRIILWLISLYQPTLENIQKLSELFEFPLLQFQKSFQDNRSLADSSIYTYYTRIAEPWMMHSLQYLNIEDDVNTILNKIYEQIINNTRISAEAEQPEFKKSTSQTLNMLKRFHHFQQIVFNAESFELASITTQSRPRARIIGPLTFKMFMNKLDALFTTTASIDENHYKTLKIIYILAYRTGMRINEILGLRVQDIEGMSHLSIWVQPYGSKKQGNQHKLKTDSAERNIPIYALLKEEENKFFHDYIIEQRFLNQGDLYLFRNWNENTKLNKHKVTMPFKMIMDELFKYHDYSFHSLRHTAANNLSLLLNCDYRPLVHQLTDYTEQEYQYIRSEILRSGHGQNHWFIIAHMMGHIDPSETFKSYIHLGYLIAGHKILKHQPDIDHQFAKKLMGYNPTLKFLNKAEATTRFNFKKYSADLCKVLLNDQTNWLNSDLEDIQNEMNAINSAPHDFFSFFAGTKESKISFERFFKCLTLLELHHDPHLVSQQISLPFELVQYWYENAQQLAQLKSQKNHSRLFDQKNSKALKPAMLFSKEEKFAMVYFFEKIQKAFEKNPDQIQAVLETFLSRVSVSHTGLYYPRNKIAQLEIFFVQVKELFPQNNWHLLGQDLETSLDAKKQPHLFKLSKLNTVDHPTVQDNYIRLQLYSIKSRKALAAFKFCLHLACIGRPCKLKIKI